MWKQFQATSRKLSFRELSEEMQDFCRAGRPPSAALSEARGRKVPYQSG
jgi:hypothetical protein